jgi:hypothetical protein
MPNNQTTQRRWGNFVAREASVATQFRLNVGNPDTMLSGVGKVETPQPILIMQPARLGMSCLLQMNDTKTDQNHE